MDLLTLRPVAAFARRRTVRRVAQTVVLLAAGAVVIHGLLGPQVAPRNLGTVVTAIHWRGLLVVGLLAAGNVFCAVCPMMLVRDAARQIVPPRRRLPHWVRGKWIGIGLLFAALYTYELFGLWEQPAATAWIIVAYFLVAIGVDVTFTGASFCKHVCPIGQFNFVASTVSPTEVRIRDAGTCQSCRTADCINGRPPTADELARRGCELGLFLPAKVGNVDCTFCFDCVRACPHDNIAVETRVPATEWLATTHRSGIGRVQDRRDLTVLALLFTFGGLLAAFAMTTPGHDVRRAIAGTMGVGDAVALLLLFLGAALVTPWLVIRGVAARSSLGTSDSRLAASDIVFALVPLGFAVWVAHYGFHLLTGVLTIVPVTQSAVGDLFGADWLGAPAWRWAGMRPGLVAPLQIGCVVLGAFGSLGLMLGSFRRGPSRASTRAAWPALVVVVVVGLIALWTLMQPMDMRVVGGLG